MAKEYTQAFIVAMESGAVALIHVNGEDQSHGLGLATTEAQKRLDGQIYHMCSFPVTKPATTQTFKLLRLEGV